MACSLLNNLFVMRSSLCTRCFRIRSLSSSKILQRSSHNLATPEDADTKKQVPIMTSRKLLFPPGKPPKQAWVDSLDITKEDKLGIVDLHPEIFSVFPRIDVVWANVFWQQMYKKVNYEVAKTRAEMPGGGRKPWPQKGTGRARQGSNRSPLWHKGGKAFGPRGPQAYFYMLPDTIRVLGLRTALTIKYAQNNLHIIDNLDLPSSDPEYLMNLVEHKEWGLSVLFVDDTDFISENMALASNEIKQYNVLPVYGLNVYSMLKHETLILTLAAVEKIEERLLTHMNSIEYKQEPYGPKTMGRAV